MVQRSDGVALSIVFAPELIRLADCSPAPRGQPPAPQTTPNSQGYSKNWMSAHAHHGIIIFIGVISIVK